MQNTVNSHIRENLHYGEVHAFSDLFASYTSIRNKPMGAVSSRENLVRLDLFTQAWAV